MAQIKRDSPDFQFRVAAADGLHEINDETDIDRFGAVLAALDYVAPMPLSDGPTAAQEKFVFTTPFDAGLGQSLHQEGGAVHVFRTAIGDAPAGGAKARRIRFLPLEQPNPWPGWWLLRREPRPPAAGDAGAGSRVVEERLKVSLF